MCVTCYALSSQSNRNYAEMVEYFMQHFVWYKQKKKQSNKIATTSVRFRFCAFVLSTSTHIIIIVITIIIDFMVAIFKLKAITNERLHDKKTFSCGCTCEQTQNYGREKSNGREQRVQISNKILHWVECIQHSRAMKFTIKKI